jgi:hypothetical protein
MKDWTGARSPEYGGSAENEKAGLRRLFFQLEQLTSFQRQQQVQVQVQLPERMQQERQRVQQEQQRVQQAQQLLPYRKQTESGPTELQSEQSVS